MMHKMHKKKNPQYVEHNKKYKRIDDNAQKKSVIHCMECHLKSRTIFFVTFPMSFHFCCNNFHALILEENHEAKVNGKPKVPCQQELKPLFQRQTTFTKKIIF